MYYILRYSRLLEIIYITLNYAVAGGEEKIKTIFLSIKLQKD